MQNYLKAMTPLALALLLGLCGNLVIAAEEKGTSEDAKPLIVAKVNGVEITEDQVVDEIDALVASAGGRIPGQQIEQRHVLFFRQGLDRSVEGVLLDMAGKKEKVEVTDEDIEGTIAHIRAQQKLADDAAFDDFLKQQEMTRERLTEKIREQMFRQKVIETQTDKAAAPEKEDVRKFYDENPVHFEKMQASHILLTTKDISDDEKKAAREKLTQIKADITSEKTTFEDAAKEFSACPSGKQAGGDLGLQGRTNNMGRPTWVKPFSDAAFALKTGEISDIVETQFGYHIIKATVGKEDGTTPFEEVQENIERYLLEKAKVDVITAYIESLRKEAKIEETVTEDEWGKLRQAKQKPAAGDLPPIKIKN